MEYPNLSSFSYEGFLLKSDFIEIDLCCDAFDLLRMLLALEWDEPGLTIALVGLDPLGLEAL